jgi:hypothetical protein
MRLGIAGGDRIPPVPRTNKEMLRLKLLHKFLPELRTILKYLQERDLPAFNDTSTWLQGQIIEAILEIEFPE